MIKPKIGLLPLYLKLYEKSVPELLGEMTKFLGDVETKLKEQGLDLIVSDISKEEPDFIKAVELFEEKEVDAILTLHLSYSPSLEVLPALKNTNLPIIVLDTTVDYAFDENSSTDLILNNHGIHGVQDMCGVLYREGIKYKVFAGHYEKSNVLDKVKEAAVAAMMVKKLKTSRIGKIGAGFKGMGDFEIGEKSLTQLGIKTINYSEKDFQWLVDSVTTEEIEAEWKQDAQRFNVENLTFDVYKESERIGLATRKWIDNNALTGLTINFSDAKRETPLHTMPFAEMSKSMARGIGYAGEGDVFTAAYVGALLSGQPETSFMEMFCPDWKGNSVFLSHMGEWNIALSNGKARLTEKEFPFADAPNPAVINGCFKSGQAALINIAKNSHGGYNMIVASGEMITSKDSPEMINSVRGWFKPVEPLAEFLENYSNLGGGHHGALVYNPDINILNNFAYFMGWNFQQI